MLKSLRHYYFSLYNQYWKLSSFDEEFLPGIEHIEKILSEFSVDNTLKNSKAKPKKISRQGMFKNDDLEGLAVIPKSEEDFEDHFRDFVDRSRKSKLFNMAKLADNFVMQVKPVGFPRPPG